MNFFKHKSFTSISSFQYIFGTTGTTHYGVGKIFSILVQIMNELQRAPSKRYPQDSKRFIWEVNGIHKIPNVLFEKKSFQYLSFNIASVITKDLLEGAINAILRRI